MPQIKARFSRVDEAELIWEDGKRNSNQITIVDHSGRWLCNFIVVGDYRLKHYRLDRCRRVHI
jgi:hypothetical protein